MVEIACGTVERRHVVSSYFNTYSAYWNVPPTALELVSGTRS
jgi:hypothetical protein